MSQASRFDPVGALRTLNLHGVQYVVIGGFAGAAMGSTLVTFDVDICHARDEANLRVLATALLELHARLRGAPEDVPFQLDHVTLRNGDHFTFTTDCGPLDILATPKGTTGFDQLVADAALTNLGEGVTALVASLDQLIRMKEAAGRPQDIAAVELLSALRDEIGEEPRR